MGNHQDGFSLCQLFKRQLNLMLILGIRKGSGFIENNNWYIF